MLKLAAIGFGLAAAASIGVGGSPVMGFALLVVVVVIAFNWDG